VSATPIFHPTPWFTESGRLALEQYLSALGQELGIDLRDTKHDALCMDYADFVDETTAAREMGVTRDDLHALIVARHAGGIIVRRTEFHQREDDQC